MSRAAVFLDRDGVINANRADYVLSWGEFRFLPGALRAIALLHTLGLPVVVVTNQAILTRGALQPADLREIHARMRAAVRAMGGDLLDVLYCPHDAHDNCDCRKPRPGLLLRAAREHDLDLSRSYFIGDALTDIRAGQAAGCTCLLVRTGRGTTQFLHEEARLLRGYYMVKDLYAAARWIADPSAAHPLERLRALLWHSTTVEYW